MYGFLALSFGVLVYALFNLYYDIRTRREREFFEEKIENRRAY